MSRSIDDFQAEKALIRQYYAELDEAQGIEIADVLGRYTVDNYLWRGYHPFNEILGASEVAERFWLPFKRAVSSLQRREDIFFAGRNEMDNFQSIWVVSMGHLMGLFDAPWLGIDPTRKMTFLRYAEFNRVENGQILETAMYFDIPHFMVQAGHRIFPIQTAFHLVQPGPQTHDGLLFERQPAAEGKKTLETINSMITNIGGWKSGLPIHEELALDWHEDMIWWGPEGIGATYTIPRYAEQHAKPFRAAFSERSKTTHLARLAEGNYGGFFGWPNFKARLTGDFMGMPATDLMSEFRVIDIYRRSGDKLAENWVFIDLLHFWKLHGRDFWPHLKPSRT